METPFNNEAILFTYTYVETFLLLHFLTNPLATKGKEAVVNQSFECIGKHCVLLMVSPIRVLQQS